MKYEEKLKIIIEALLEAVKTSPEQGIAHLYLKGNGLEGFDPNEVWDVLHKVEIEDKVLVVTGYPSELNLRLGDFEEFMYNTKSFFVIEIKDGFEKWASMLSNNNNLSSTQASYDGLSGTVTVDGKQVKLRKDSFRANLLSLLFKNKTSLTKEWSWDELIAKIEGIDINDTQTLKANKNRFYTACDGLTKHIASKIGVNDLLIFNKSTVQINPKYI